MFYVSRNGEQKGPFEAEIIIACLNQGIFDYSDLVWKEGWDNWKEIKQAFPEPVSKPPPLKKADDKAVCPFCNGTIALGVMKCTHCEAKLTPRALKAKMLRLGCGATLLAIFGIFLLVLTVIVLGGVTLKITGDMGYKAIPLFAATFFLWLGINYFPTRPKKFYSFLGLDVSWMVFSFISILLGAYFLILMFIH